MWVYVPEGAPRVPCFPPHLIGDVIEPIQQQCGEVGGIGGYASAEGSLNLAYGGHAILSVSPQATLLFPCVPQRATPRRHLG